MGYKIRSFFVTCIETVHIYSDIWWGAFNLYKILLLQILPHANILVLQIPCVHISIHDRELENKTHHKTILHKIVIKYA